MDHELIEKEFGLMEAKYENGRKQKKSTGCEAVLRFLVEHPKKIWWWSWEFISQTTTKGDYLSHRAPARASDLAIHHNELVEDRKIGRFSVYRLRAENMGKILEFLGESVVELRHEEKPQPSQEAGRRLITSQNAEPKLSLPTLF